MLYICFRWTQLEVLSVSYISGFFSVAKEGLLQAEVVRLFVHEFLMCSTLYNASVLHVTNQVCILDRRQTVSDHKRRSTLLCFLQCFLHDLNKPQTRQVDSATRGKSNQPFRSHCPAPTWRRRE